MVSFDLPPVGAASAAGANVDADEVAKFSAIASRWWDPEGEFRPLHRLNPVRTGYVVGRVDLAGARVLDVGCGGGLLSESLAARGAAVLGIDASADTLAAARAHLGESGLYVDYRATTAEALAEAKTCAIRPAAWAARMTLEYCERSEAIIAKDGCAPGSGPPASPSMRRCSGGLRMMEREAL